MLVVIGAASTVIATTATLTYWLVGGVVEPGWIKALAIAWGTFLPLSGIYYWIETQG